MQKWLIIAMSSVASAALAATVTLDGETEYAVATNVTTTVADTLTGSGSIRKTGPGTLELSGTGNDFTGGVVVEAGIVQANAAEAFGTGTITLPNRDARAYFNVAPATSGGYTLFPNALSFTGSQDAGLSGTNPDGRHNVVFYQNTHLTNAISGTRGFRLRHNPKSTSSPKNGGPSTIFDGPLSVASGKTIYLNVYGSMVINGPITASTLFGGVSPCSASYDNYSILNSYPWLDLARSCFTAARGRRVPPGKKAPFDERRFMSIVGMAVKNAYSGALSPQAALDYAQRLMREQFPEIF